VAFKMRLSSASDARVPLGRRVKLCLALVLAALAVGCDFPADPEGTLDRVRGGTMSVGVIENPPWVVLDAQGEPSGVEPELVRRFADTIDADIEWVEGPEADLAAAMGGFQLDLLIGGLTRDFPYVKDVAMTRPYVDTEVEIGVPPGEDLPDELGGVEVHVERASEAAALLREEEDDAIPVPFDSLDEVDGIALLDTHDIDAIGYDRTDYILRDHEHAMAVPLGENAFMVELEKFLLDRGEEAEDLLHEEVSG
jgi:polar amino acid transport system substrate-binding protein